MSQKFSIAPSRHRRSTPAEKRAAASSAALDLRVTERRKGVVVSFKKVYQIEPLELVDLIKKGVPAHTVVELARRMSITKERLFATLGLPRATVDRKVRENKALSPDESSRVLGVARLVGHAQTLVDESGEPQDFNAAQWVANWLAQPMPALAGHCPAELMDTAEGQAIVANLLERAQSGAYA
ncbi:MAG: DUF2384 domain-containing protein [Betaproteobacteria bacterium]|nr:DUF2384 domain-containing protein [Betaproteobacteria bacterium]